MCIHTCGVEIPVLATTPACLPLSGRCPDWLCRRDHVRHLRCDIPAITLLADAKVQQLNQQIIEEGVWVSGGLRLWKGADVDGSDLAGTSDDEEWQRGHGKEINDQASTLGANCSSTDLCSSEVEQAFTGST